MLMYHWQAEVIACINKENMTVFPIRLKATDIIKNNKMAKDLEEKIKKEEQISKVQRIGYVTFLIAPSAIGFLIDKYLFRGNGVNGSMAGFVLGFTYLGGLGEEFNRWIERRYNKKNKN